MKTTCAIDITCSLGLLGYRRKVDLSVFTYNCLAMVEERGRSQDPQTWSVKRATVAFQRFFGERNSLVI